MTIPAEPAVRLDSATVRFMSERGAITALEKVSVAIPAGGFVTLLGPSGCGKSTLLRLVADLVPAAEGQVTVLGGTPATARATRQLGFVFQDPTLLPWRSALDNVRLPFEVGPRKGDARGRKGRADRQPFRGGRKSDRHAGCTTAPRGRFGSPF